jgi:hypothetical protein
MALLDKLSASIRVDHRIYQNQLRFETVIQRTDLRWLYMKGKVEYLEISRDPDYKWIERK